jgi:hypothetical protein
VTKKPTIALQGYYNPRVREPPEKGVEHETLLPARS